MSKDVKPEDLVPAEKLELNLDEFEEGLNQFLYYWDTSGKEVFPGPVNDQNPWHGIAVFKEYFNIDTNVEHYPEMLEKAFGKTGLEKRESNEYFRGSKFFPYRGNANTYPVANLVDLAKEEPKLIRAILENLYDESIDLYIRLENFQKNINDNLEKIPSLHGKESVIKRRKLRPGNPSIILWFLDPEKYYILESQNGQNLCNLFLNELPRGNCDSNQDTPVGRQLPLAQEYEMLQVLSKELKENDSFREELEKRNFLSEYQDPNYSCFLFYFVEFYRKFYNRDASIPHTLNNKTKTNKIQKEKLFEGNTIIVDSKTSKIEEAEEVILVKDGAKQKYFVSRYERNPKNRKEAIELHGTKCMACGFDFGEVYGDFGKDYIEVHHLTPLSSLDKEVEIDPKKDLVVLCSNCHRMMHHKQDRVLSLDDLKKMIKENKESSKKLEDK